MNGVACSGAVTMDASAESHFGLQRAAEAAGDLRVIVLTEAGWAFAQIAIG